MVRLRLAPVALALAACVENNPTNQAATPAFDSLGQHAIDPPPPGVLHVTVDDGPSLEFTKDIIDVVTRHGAPSTFFVVGVNIPGKRELLAYAQQRGHQIGSHSYYHDAQPSLSHARFEHGLRAVKANIGRTDGDRLYFRFPYGQSEPEQLAWLAQVDFGGRRYRPVGWNIDSQDWAFGLRYVPGQHLERSDAVSDVAGACNGVANPFIDDYVGWCQFVARKRGGGVMLFHDIQRITHDKLDEVLTGFENPAAYWAALERADPARAAAYRAYYQCEAADPMLTFRYAALNSGHWPSLND